MDALQAYALSKKYTKESLQGAGAIKGEDGFSPTITESQDNSDSEYRLDITDKNGTFKTPNLKGEKGESGLTGAQGIQGIKGDRGQQGEQGVQGLQGIQGPKGDDGYPFLIYKEYAALSDFDAADFPEIGLMFMVKEKELGAFPVYRYTGDGEEPYSYITGLSEGEGIKGEKGDPGEQGPQGVQGEDGNDGTTYTPTIGSVTSGETAAASVILDDEEKTAEFSFVLPKGDKGDNSYSIAIKANEEIFNGPIAANETYSFRKSLDNFDEIWLGIFFGDIPDTLMVERTVPVDLAVGNDIKIDYVGTNGNAATIGNRKFTIRIMDNDSFNFLYFNLYGSQIGSLVIRGIKYAEASEVESGGKLEISQSPGNAIVEKEDGIFVQDNSKDIGKLQEDVNNVSNKVDTIKKYQRYVNTELDYAYLRTNLVSSLALKTDTVIPFDTFVGGSGIEIDLENYGVVLKAGKTYKLTCSMRISSTAGYITAGFYDIEKNKYLSMLSKVTSNYSVSSDNGCGFLVITPTKDTTIQVRVAGLNGTATFTTAANDYNILIVEEINHSIVIDPVEYVNTQSGIEDTPVGHILTHMGTKAPKHYLVCDGTEYNIADYPYLAQHFIDDFGSVNYFGGDGETTFAVPDLRGEFLRGAGEAARATGAGGEVGQHQEPTKHIWTQINPNNNIVYPKRGTKVNPEYPDKYIPESQTTRYTNVGSSDNATFYTNYTSRPTNTSVLYCIKYEPTYFMKMADHIYSYEERLVGTWVDGKPLYEKTVNFGALPNATTKEVPHGIENVDVIWVHDGYVKNESANWCYPLILSSPYNIAHDWSIGIATNKIIAYTGVDQTSSAAMVTLRYTKTTDQPLI